MLPQLTQTFGNIKHIFISWFGENPAFSTINQMLCLPFSKACIIVWCCMKNHQSIFHDFYCLFRTKIGLQRSLCFMYMLRKAIQYIPLNTCQGMMYHTDDSCASALKKLSISIKHLYVLRIIRPSIIFSWLSSHAPLFSCTPCPQNEKSMNKPFSKNAYKRLRKA